MQNNTLLRRMRGIMHVLLTEDPEYLYNIAQRYGIAANSLISTNPHLQNLYTTNIGDLLIVPIELRNEKSVGNNRFFDGVNLKSLYKLEPYEVQRLISYSKFLHMQTAEITWTVVISGGSAIVTLAGTAAVAGISIVVGAAAAAGLAYLSSGKSRMSLNSATNVGIPPPTSPNASVNANSNTNTANGVRILMTEMAHAKEKIESEFASTIKHLSYLQNGKDPDCLPGSQCYENNRNHWKGEVRKFLNNAEKYLKRVKGKTKEALKRTIEEFRKEANKF